MTDNQRCNGKEYLFSLVRLKPECKVQPTFVDFEPLYGYLIDYSGWQHQLEESFRSSTKTTVTSLPPFCSPPKRYLVILTQKTQSKNIQTDKLLFEHRVR